MFKKKCGVNVCFLTREHSVQTEDFGGNVSNAFLTIYS